MESQIYKASNKLQLHLFNLYMFGMGEVTNTENFGECRLCSSSVDTECASSTLFPDETLFMHQECMDSAMNEIDADKKAFETRLRKSLSADEIHKCEKCGAEDNWIWDGMEELGGPFPKRMIFCQCGSQDMVKTYSNETNLKYFEGDKDVRVYTREDEPEPKIDFNTLLPSMIYIDHGMVCDYPNCDKNLPMFRGGYKGNTWYVDYLPECSVHMEKTEYGTVHRLDFCKEHLAEANLPTGIFLFVSIKDYVTNDSDHVKKYRYEKTKKIKEAEGN